MFALILKASIPVACESVSPSDDEGRSSESDRKLRDRERPGGGGGGPRESTGSARVNTRHPERQSLREGLARMLSFLSVIFF